MIYDELQLHVAEDDGMAGGLQQPIKKYIGPERRKDREARELYELLPGIARQLGVNPADIASFLMMGDERTLYKKIIADYRHESGSGGNFAEYASGQMKYIHDDMLAVCNAEGEGFGQYC